MKQQQDEKEIIKAAIKEWLDSKFVLLGQWSLGIIVALLLSTALYFVLWVTGWHNEFVSEPNKDRHKVPFSSKNLEDNRR